MNYSHPHNINTLSKCCLKFFKGGLWEIRVVSDLFHCIKNNVSNYVLKYFKYENL